MNVYQTVEEFYEPREILKEMSRIGESEMSESDHSFLCGLIKKYKPKKILEVGVAAGVTTTVLLNTIKILNLDSVLYSIDLSEKYYRDGIRNTGYFVDKAVCHGITKDRLNLMLGKIVPERLDEIGKDIDFVVLDTIHSLPGEILDFLAILPYLKKGAIVVLHDMRLQFKKPNAYATSVLLHSVVADKFLNNAEEYPNISAFRINEDTHKYIMDVFGALTISWDYLPDINQLEKYEKFYRRYYSEECVKIYCQARKCNIMYTWGWLKDDFADLNDLSVVKPFERVLIYGTKLQGLRCLYYCQKNGIKIDGFVVSDGWKNEEQIEGVPVYEFSKIPYSSKEAFILLANSSVEPETNLESSEYSWVKLLAL